MYFPFVQKNINFEINYKNKQNLFLIFNKIANLLFCNNIKLINIFFIQVGKYDI